MPLNSFKTPVPTTSSCFRYYRRKGPKIDVRLVILITITVISAFQYYVKHSRYEEAVNYFVTVRLRRDCGVVTAVTNPFTPFQVPKYRNKALDMLSSEKSAHDLKKEAKKTKLSKAEQKELQEKEIRKIIQGNMDIQGSYSKPSVTDVLWVQLVMSPYTLVKYVAWYGRWTLNFTILKKEYGEEEKLYLIRKNLGMGVHQFNAIEDNLIDDYLRQELWIKENFKEWKDEQDEEMKLKMAESSKYKSYRRWEKKNKSRMTFTDD